MPPVLDGGQHQGHGAGASIAATASPGNDATQPRTNIFAFKRWLVIPFSWASVPCVLLVAAEPRPEAVMAGCTIVGVVLFAAALYPLER